VTSPLSPQSSAQTRHVFWSPLFFFPPIIDHKPTFSFSLKKLRARRMLVKTPFNSGFRALPPFSPFLPYNECSRRNALLPCPLFKPWVVSMYLPLILIGKAVLTSLPFFFSPQSGTSNKNRLIGDHLLSSPTFDLWNSLWPRLPCSSIHLWFRDPPFFFFFFLRFGGRSPFFLKSFQLSRSLPSCSALALSSPLGVGIMVGVRWLFPFPYSLIHELLA